MFFQGFFAFFKTNVDPISIEVFRRVCNLPLNFTVIMLSFKVFEVSTSFPFSFFIWSLPRCFLPQNLTLQYGHLLLRIVGSLRWKNCLNFSFAFSRNKFKTECRKDFRSLYLLLFSYRITIEGRRTYKPKLIGFIKGRYAPYCKARVWTKFNKIALKKPQKLQLHHSVVSRGKHHKTDRRLRKT